MRSHFVIGQLGCSSNPLCMISRQQGVLKRDRWSHCWHKFQVEIGWTYHTESNVVRSVLRFTPVEHVAFVKPANVAQQNQRDDQQQTNSL